MCPRARRFRLRSRLGWLVAAAALAGAVQAQPVEVEFVPSSAALEYAARAYREIWDEYGAGIVAALETRTCLAFTERKVSAVIADAVSHSGGPDHPMQLRASYARDMKQATLVHELGHRHLWQLTERLDDIDGHQTLYLILDLVWADVWGEAFAQDRILAESSWQSGYDYVEAWSWARSLALEERARLWHRLLEINGLGAGCDALSDRAD